MRIKQPVAQLPPAFAVPAQSIPRRRGGDRIVVIVPALDKPALDKFENQLADGPQVTGLSHLLKQFARRMPVVGLQAGQLQRRCRIGISEMERRLAQRTRLAHQKHVAAFQVAMRIASRSLQRQATGNDAVNHVPHCGAVHAAVAGDPGLERVARVKVSDIPRARGGNAEGVNGRQAATAFTVGLLELLDPFEELQAKVFIERLAA